MILNNTYFILNSIFITDYEYFIKKCPYKNGNKILISDVYYKLLVGKNKNKTKLYHKLKYFLPEKWHSYIDFIVVK